MKEEIELLITKTETQITILNGLINSKQTKSDLDKFETVKRFVDGFLIDLKNINNNENIRNAI